MDNQGSDAALIPQSGGPPEDERASFGESRAAQPGTFGSPLQGSANDRPSERSDRSLGICDNEDARLEPSTSALRSGAGAAGAVPPDSDHWTAASPETSLYAWRRSDDGPQPEGVQNLSKTDNEPSTWRNEAVGGPFGREERTAEEPRGFITKARDEVSAWLGDEAAARRRFEDDASRRGDAPITDLLSDESLRKHVADLLADDPVVDAREIRVTVEDRQVTLTGAVRRREEARRAEDICGRAYGVASVQNDLSLSGGGDQDRASVGALRAV